MKNLPRALIKSLNEKKKHKYGAIRTVCLHGHNHDSRKEAMWCLKLHQMQQEGTIRNIVCEPLVALMVNEMLVCHHLPDFSYEIKNGEDWRCEVLDVKGDWMGGKRPEWILKRRLFNILFPDIKYVVV